MHAQPPCGPVTPILALEVGVVRNADAHKSEDSPSASTPGSGAPPTDGRDHYTEDRDIWRDYNARQEFEHLLIDRKTTWLMTSQSILFVAYGLTVAEKSDAPAGFRLIIAGAGLAVAALAAVGVHALIRSKELSWCQYERFYKRKENRLPGPLADDDLQWGVKTDNTRITLLPDRLLPYVFGIAWTALLIVAIYQIWTYS